MDGDGGSARIPGRGRNSYGCIVPIVIAAILLAIIIKIRGNQIYDEGQLVEAKVVYSIENGQIIETPDGKYWKIRGYLGAIGEISTVTKRHLVEEVPNKVIKFNENKP